MLPQKGGQVTLSLYAPLKGPVFIRHVSSLLKYRSHSREFFTLILSRHQLVAQIFALSSLKTLGFLHLLGALIDGESLWKRAPGSVQTLEGN